MLANIFFLIQKIFWMQSMKTSHITQAYDASSTHLAVNKITSYIL